MIPVSTYRDLAGSLQLCVHNQNHETAGFPAGPCVLLTWAEWHSLQQRASTLDHLRERHGTNSQRVVLSNGTR